ncbi:hypothetical protein EFA46_016060 (plasmid) [Halarchaeum sp. CBA1220]|uniref:hypothetical protein n=1 Tax=Halarchaeum sp. CBA1220 TaxID=1853682 RepID=UPI0015A0F270|nr:hypothetical protein [Halarchaeum sp. CBA1220]QLC35771.1 hypothetical protein EFA46_016060 [Halarchaeum sp. CBA1220]
MSDVETPQEGGEDHPAEWEGVARDLLAGKLQTEHMDLRDAINPVVTALERNEEVSPRDVDAIYTKLTELEATLRHVERATPGRDPTPPLEEFVDRETLHAYSEATRTTRGDRDA